MQIYHRSRDIVALALFHGGENVFSRIQKVYKIVLPTLKVT